MWFNNNNNKQSNEASPLLAPSNASGNGGTTNAKYYFLASPTGRRTEDGGQVVEGIPEGSHTDEFAPKQLPPMSSPAQKARKQQQQAQAAQQQQNGNNFWSAWFGGKSRRPPQQQQSQRSGGGGGGGTGEIGTLVKLRKAPIKIEPKVFFANERTFLAWMHLSVTLAGASIAILAFAQDQNAFSQLYGVVLLPVAIAFIVYSMYQYARRATMIRTRHPGPYEDTVGPTVLGVMLMVSIVTQFALKLYAMTENA